MIIKLQFLFVLIALSSCASKSSTISVESRPDENSGVTMANSVEKPKYTCDTSGQCLKVNVSDLNELNERYEYKQVIMYSAQKIDTTKFDYMISTLKNPKMTIDSVLLKNGSGVTIKSFFTGAGIGLGLFLVIPPISYLNSEDSENSLTYGPFTFILSMLLGEAVALGLDHMNRDVVLHPVSNNEVIMVRRYN